MQVRIGLPTSFRRFSTAAREMGAPILVSANAFRRRDSTVFRPPSSRLFSGVPVALDSAGFVAMYRYGGFPWSVRDYVGLAAAYPWDWWAQMDLCCEPEIARDHAEVRRRIMKTADLLRSCREVARERDIGPPMPVLQGWRPGDYLDCAARMSETLDGLPPLVGVGSVCRRDVSGRDGVMAIVDALDAALPPRTRLHLFGVKGSAIRTLSQHPRIHSVDSMAWDLQARYASSGPNTLDHRIAHMHRWYARQVESLPQQPGNKPPAKDPAAKWRQRTARAKRTTAGEWQVNLWLPPELVTLLDGRREPGETRSDCVRRLFGTWAAQGATETAIGRPPSGRE
jgi:hypothetical protein